MNLKQRQAIINAQKDAFKRHGFHPNALFWSNTEVQELRFKILAGIGINAGVSVLDVGCGFGDFAHFLTRDGKPVNYTGIDLSADLIKEGQTRYPNITLLVTDLFDYDPAPESVDYVTLSGALNRKLDYLAKDDSTNSSKSYALNVITKMYHTCRKGIAFNLLDARHEWTASRWDLQSFDPDEIMDFIEHEIKPTGKHHIIDGYLENDFTVYLFKNTL